jgi:ATP-dependent Lon protease
LNPILKDRLVKINLSGFSTTEKINISKNYILKELNRNIGFDDNAVIFSDESIKEIIETYTDEQGVRELRRCIETILLKINMRRFTEEVRFPLQINSDIIKEYLKKQNTDDFLSKMLYL